MWGDERPATKWYGWGDERIRFPLSERPGFLAYLRRHFGELPAARDPVPLEAIPLPPPAVPPAFFSALDGDRVRQDAAARLTHALGKSYPDLVRTRTGQVLRPPDAVVYPATEEEVRHVLRLAAAHEVAVIPFGGGTSVVGGIEPRPLSHQRGAVSLDMRGFGQILAVDALSLVADVGAGVDGPALEAQLNARGYTLGHFPQSFEFSTLGGWAATRSSGQFSCKYGRIEDMVVSLTLLSPAGEIVTRPVPASATGPSLLQLALGSEGIFGVITAVRLRIHPLPRARRLRAFFFRDFGSGLEAVREMMQAGLRPAMARLSDPDETAAALALSAPPHDTSRRLIQQAGLWMLRRRGYEQGCLLILVYEGDARELRQEEPQATACCRDHGAFYLGSSPARAWYRERFSHPYLRDELLAHGIVTDTLETAASWTQLPQLYAKVKEAIAGAIAATGSNAVVYAHVSHSYPDGASLYYTFLARQDPTRPLEQWSAVKRAASDAIMAAGGTISHHHGIGADHAPWLVEEHGRLGLEALAAVKRTFDPAGIMNPGKVIIDEAARRS